VTLDNAIPVEGTRGRRYFIERSATSKASANSIKEKDEQANCFKYSISTSLLTLAAYFIATKGVTYVKDNVGSSY
jgi:hypothetical protein